MLQDQLAKELGIKKSQLSKFKARGCPIDDVGKAKTWITSNIRKRTKGKAAAPDPACPVSTELPPKEDAPVADEFTWEARLDRARKMEVLIDATVRAAVGRKEYGQLTNLLASYQKALQGIREAEEQALQTRLQSGELIQRDTARAIMADLLIPLRNALDHLPLTLRSRCNPADPKVAEDALRAWVNALLLRLSQAEIKF